MLKKFTTFVLWLYETHSDGSTKVTYLFRKVLLRLSSYNKFSQNLYQREGNSMAPASIDGYTHKGWIISYRCGLLLVLSTLRAMREACYKDKAIRFPHLFYLLIFLLGEQKKKIFYSWSLILFVVENLPN